MATDPSVGSSQNEQAAYNSSGYLQSNIIDTQQLSSFSTITYNTTIPDTSSASLRFRSSSNNDMSGAPNFSTCTAVNSGDNLSTNNCITNGQRYLQYQVSLGIGSSKITPIFYDLTFYYSLATFTLNYSPGANGSLGGSLTQVVNAGTSGSAITPLPATHFHFVNWSDGSTATPRFDTNVTQNIGVTANFAIDSFSINFAAGAHGTLSGNSVQTISYGADSSSVTAIGDTGYHFTNWSDGSAANPRTIYNVIANKSVTANFAPDDIDAPQISTIVAEPASQSSTITWLTNENASSQIQYGLNPAYGFSTDVADTSPYLTSHSITLSNLKSCARYYYRVLSSDPFSNDSVSAQKSFNTTGCLTSSLLGGTDTVVPTSGGTIELVNHLSTAQLQIPQDTNRDSATFQLNKLDTATIFAPPAGQSIAASNLYDLIAVTQNDQQLTSFAQPITFTISYGSDVESAYDESTLDVYKFDGSQWIKKDCTLDTVANTLSCSLTGFSIYGVLGQPKTTITETIISTSSSSNPSIPPNAPSCSDAPPASTPNLFQINTTNTTAKLFFTPIANTNHFYISFSSNNLAEGNGADVSLAHEGVQNFTINLLKPNTTYYFKVRGQNGCMPGEWSNIMKMRTDSRKYYQNNSSSFENIAPKRSGQPKNPIVSLTPTSIPETKVQPPSPPSVLTPAPKRSYLLKLLSLFHFSL